MRRFFGAFAFTLCAALTMSFASCSLGSSDSEGNPGTTTITTGNSGTTTITTGNLADSSGSSDSEEKDETPAVKNYTVTFDSDGGSEVASQAVESGKTATKPADPTKSGEKTSYAFLGWYNGDSVFDFASTIKSDVTLKAKWLEGFVKVPGTTIKGDETWSPESEVFISKRRLTIGELYVCDHEVTRGEYKALMGTDPSKASAYDKDGNELTGDNALNNPVNYVNWYNAIVYCNKLSIKEGLTPCYTISGSIDPDNWGSVPTSDNSTWEAATCDFEAGGYRLPTEAEWEWLARGGENYTYAGSNTVKDVAWYSDNTNGSRDVKTKAANGYGLYDMSGNVWEWCWDWYNSNVNSDTGAFGVSSGDNRVLRGGAWCRNFKYDSSEYCRVAYRDHDYPFDRGSYSTPRTFGDYGIRLVRSAQ